MAKKKRRTELDIDDSLVAEPAPPPPEEPAAEPPEKTPEEPETPAPEPPPKKKVNKVKLLIVASSGLGAVLLVAAVIWGITAYVKSRPEAPEPAPEPVVKEAKEEKEPAASLAPAPAVDIPPVYQFRDFYVNMDSGDGVVIARIALAAQMSDAKVKDEIVRNLVLVRENIYAFLRSRKLAKFSDEKAKREMAVEIAIILNRSIQSGAVTKVYITGLSLE